jgi:glycosyltransferase involved in cell wall biosynthesis
VKYEKWSGMSLIKVAVDASRVRSGGGVAHLFGILNITEPTQFGIAEIHVWAYQKLLDMLPERAWLIKHHSPELERSLLYQLSWQATKLAKQIQIADCHILFSADASTLCRFQPMVVLNQNMLAYDAGVLALFGFGKDRVQQTLMYFVQRAAFKFARASIFLTEHAATQVQRKVGPLSQTVCISHGVAQVFKDTAAKAQWPSDKSRPIRCLYVSPVFEYKHQLEVVQAVAMLREQGFALSLAIVGGGGVRAKRLLAKQLQVSDPNKDFIEVLEFIPNEHIASMLAEADLFVFASSCETFGIALLEAMTVGIPIACSNRSSLPETLRDGGEYFDPQDPASIAQALKTLIEQPAKRAYYSERAKVLAASYSWQRCAAETWPFIAQCYAQTRVGGSK